MIAYEQNGISRSRLYQSQRRRRRSLTSQSNSHFANDDIAVISDVTRERQTASNEIKISKQGMEALLADMEMFSKHIQAQKKNKFPSSPRISSTPTSTTKRSDVAQDREVHFCRSKSSTSIAAKRGSSTLNHSDVTEETNLKKLPNSSSCPTICGLLGWMQKNGKKAAKRYKLAKQYSTSSPRPQRLVNTSTETFELVKDEKCNCKTLTDVFQSEVCTKEFRKFLSKEMSEENLDFFLAVECYKKQTKEKHLKRADEIFKEYLAPFSLNEVNVDSYVRKQTQENMQYPTANTFDLAQEQIFRLMETDSFRRFSEKLR